jgi:hypothetical protein
METHYDSVAVQLHYHFSLIQPIMS